jgi:hypothetical protein
MSLICLSLITVQFFNIIIHVAKDEIEPICIISKLIIISDRALVVLC